MANKLRAASNSLLSLAGALFLSVHGASADILAQGPCNYEAGRCMGFDGATNPMPAIRSFEFSLPAPGNALVRFDGTLQCWVDSPTANQDVIDLATQIVTSADAVPSYPGPGGARFAMRLNHNNQGFGPSAAINLASSRLIKYTTAGAATVYFKIVQLRMDAGTACNVLSGAFSVITVP